MPGSTEAAGWLAFDTVEARWWRRRCSEDELPAAAIAALEAGCDTPSLRVLAGADGLGWSEARPLLGQIRAERGQPRLTRPQVDKLLVHDLLTQIVSGDITPEAGAGRAWELAVELDDDRLWDFGRLSDDYGLLGVTFCTAEEIDHEVLRQSRELLAGGEFRPG